MPGWKYSLSLAAALLFALALAWSSLGRQIDFWAYDLLLRALPPSQQKSASVIVAIDEQTLETYGGLLALRSPLAQALDILSQADPLAVAVDVVLSEPRTPEENAPLAEALGRIPTVVLAANLRAEQGAGWEMPIEPFARHAAAVGHAHAEPDPDGVCRRVLLAKAHDRTRLWSMGLETHRVASGAPPIAETPQHLELGDARIPASYRDDRQLLLRFANPAQPIERISLARLLEDPSLAETVRGRAVFIGVLVLGGLDRYLMTPYSYGRPMAGVEINATVYETLARGRFLQPVSPATALLAALLIALVTAWIFHRFSGRTAVLFGAVALLAAHALPVVAFLQDAVFPASQSLLVGWMCFGVGAAWNYLGVGQARDRAERQTERYQKAVHYVTHEMRTPLTAIQGSSELISRYSLPEDRQRQIGELIHKESQRLSRMVEMFLSVERLSAGELELHRESVDADQLIAESVERLRPLAARKRIQIDHQPCDDAPIDGDRELLEYACYNLISNAVKYSPADTAISVRAWRENERTFVSVEDQGYGMDPSELRDIFKRFYRARTADRSGENGSGLGLALVEEIVVGHGGSIAVESQIDRGSRFTLDLPAALERTEP